MKKTIDTEVQEYNSVIEALNEAVLVKDAIQRDFRLATQETGLSSSWLSAFAAGGIREAGYMKIRRLQRWLTDKGHLPRNNDPDTACGSFSTGAVAGEMKRFDTTDGVEL